MKFLSSILLTVIFFSSGLSLAEELRFDDLFVLSEAERSTYTVDSIKKLDQEGLDILYAQLEAGALPNADYSGTVIFDSSESNEIERILAIISPTGFLESLIKKLGVSLWKKKIFDPANRSMTNRILLLKQYPAHMYCGISLVDTRRESIILDYNFADSLPSYVPLVDWAMGRTGLAVRDEIRMVRPGLYLGRAYLRGTFALNFVLEQKGFKETKDSWTNFCTND
ncbi:MAG: hypothetical protein EOP07_26275 [Proteobacteria bacterium]|nr:MAG: hypothetical protein EOP07_26275 [Pseudomonadota bacterium]